jgi:hypothetical protein
LARIGAEHIPVRLEARARMLKSLSCPVAMPVRRAGIKAVDPAPLLDINRDASAAADRADMHVANQA